MADPRIGHAVRMGRRLYLLRHAKSSWESPALADHDRPLAARGRRASGVMGEHFRSQRIAPTLVLCSSAARTRETLERIRPSLGDGIEVRIEDGIYGASAGELLDLLHGVTPGVESVMVIGHNPALQELALLLAATGSQLERLSDKFPTAALATLTFAGCWGELAGGTAELVAFVTPRELARTPG
jgi:phosphohistidine phosphatase